MKAAIQLPDDLQLEYKGILYFLRAYQDAMAAALRIAGGEIAGTRTTMPKVLKRPNRQAKAVFDSLPNYEPWFIRWRRARNNVKFGAAFSSVGPQSNPGVAFQICSIDEKGAHLTTNLKNAVRIGDVVQAIEMCVALCEAVTLQLSKGGAQSDESSIA